MQAQIGLWAAHGNSPKPEVGPKGKKAEVVAAKKAAKGIEDEKKLAEVVGGLMEAVEKEDAVSFRRVSEWREANGVADSEGEKEDCGSGENL